MTGTRKPMKIMKIAGKELSALIDTGSDVNLMSWQCYKSLTGCKYDDCDVVLTGLGSTRIRALGQIITSVSVDDVCYRDITFYIVQNNAIPCSVIIGQQFLQHTVMVMDGSDVYFMLENENWLQCVACVVSDFDIIGREVSPGVQRAVGELVTSYQPVKTREAPIKLKLHLKDDIPVAQRPRRVALKEQIEIDAQVKQWLQDGIIRQRMNNKRCSGWNEC
ncbi:uncharacterized protein LOC126381430 [Pectinophora gossypiella]|uniref:uncharacterized protein LOC126381430 n=1 Tax=Pectinophora gossypiella TaxID=13191 RepID=UPI00214E3EB8|nr:uncharacterized protein LOC126381430 [Pectinophora gossypiella]